MYNAELGMRNVKFGVHHSELFSALGSLRVKVAKVMVTGTVLNIKKENECRVEKWNLFLHFCQSFCLFEDSVLKKLDISLACAAFCAVFFSSCSDNGTSSESEKVFDASVVCPVEGVNINGDPNRGTFTDDRDGKVYKYTTIGNQVWMAEYLNYEGPDSYCVEETCALKGRAYFLTSARTACPNGWHLPSREEWDVLFTNMGGIDIAGSRLKATYGWTPLNPGQLSNGSDDCGFGLLPVPAEDSFSIFGRRKERVDGYCALMWTSSTDNVDESMWGVYFLSNALNVHVENYYTYNGILSIRCLKD